MLTERNVADLLDRSEPEPEPVDGPPLTIVSSFPGIASLELRGVAYSWDPATDALTLSRTEWGYVLRCWTEHILTDAATAPRRAGTIEIVDNPGPFGGSEDPATR